MSRLEVTDRDGNAAEAEGAAGYSLMEVLRAAGYEEIQAICGGNCSCATCHVYVDPAFLDRLPAMSPGEEDLLDILEHSQQNSRLSCQIPFGPELENLKVTIPPED